MNYCSNVGISNLIHRQLINMTVHYVGILLFVNQQLQYGGLLALPSVKRDREKRELWEEGVVIDMKFYREKKSGFGCSEAVPAGPSSIVEA
jgi:hypothetical protein